MKRILVISWFFPPINSSEGLVTYKLLNNSQYEYDVYTQKSNDSWAYGKNDFLPLNDNIKCVFSTATNLNEFTDAAMKYYVANIDKYDIIMTRSMPEESHVLGLKIKKLNSKIIWIASFGDPIGNNPFTLSAIRNVNPYSVKNRYLRKMGIKEMLSPKRFLKSCLYEKRYKQNYDLYIKDKNRLEEDIIKNCDYIICNNSFQKEYITKNNSNYSDEIKDKFILLPHTYDDKLYPSEKSKKGNKLVFSYIGHLDDIRTPRLFLEAVNKLNTENENLADLVEFNFYGNMSFNDKVYIIDNELFDVVKIRKPVSYIESLEIMKNSDWLIHIDANLFEIMDENIFFAAKLADYIGSKTNIMSLTMLDGASADIMRDIEGLITTYSKEEVYNYLYLIVYKGFEVNMNSENMCEFSAVNVAQKFDNFIKSEVLNEN